MLIFDERQRLCRLLANRATLMIVGILWLALIARDLLAQRTPYELIFAIPLAGMVRFVLYKYYARRQVCG